MLGFHKSFRNDRDSNSGAVVPSLVPLDAEEKLRQEIEALRLKVTSATWNWSWTNLHSFPKVYQSSGKELEYTSQAGFEKLQQEQLALNLVRQREKVQRKDVMDLCQ